MEQELTALIQTTLQSELITVAVVTVIIFLFKDLAPNFASGLSFKLHKEFNEGDKVIIDEKEAVIVDIGWRQTKFQYQEDGKIVWRYVYNTRIPYINLSKVVDKHPKN